MVLKQSLLVLEKQAVANSGNETDANVASDERSMTVNKPTSLGTIRLHHRDKAWKE